MTMKLIETTVSATSVRMRYADNADAAKASQWIDFQVPVDELKFSDQVDRDVESRFLAEVRLVALRRARDAISAETQRLSDLVNRIS